MERYHGNFFFSLLNSIKFESENHWFSSRDHELFYFSIPRAACIHEMASQALTAAYVKQNTGPSYPVVIGVLCPLSTLVVLLRLVSRGISNLQFGFDDAFIIVATVSTANKGNSYQS